MFAGLALGAGCTSSHSTGAASAQAAAANKNREEDPRTGWFNPENEAAKLGIRLYPGAKVYFAQPPFRRGNYYRQETYFTTADSTESVSQFYGTEYSAGFHPNGKGNPAALVNSIGSKDTYLFELLDGHNGNTDIHVTRIHSCDNVYPGPCDQGEPGSATPN